MRHLEPSAPPPSHLTLTVDIECDGTTTLHLSGELDHADQPELDAVLRLVEHQGASAVVLDTRGLTFADSTLVEVAERLQRRLQRRGIDLVVDAPPHVRRVFELLGAHELLRREAPAGPRRARRQRASSRGSPTTASHRTRRSRRATDLRRT